MVRCVQCNKLIKEWDPITYSNENEPICSEKCLNRRNKFLYALNKVFVNKEKACLK